MYAVRSNPIVYVLDDDAAVLRSVERLVRSVGLEVESFSSASDFLSHGLGRRPSCLVVDVRMPGLSGLDLQEQLSSTGCCTPMIFITGHGTIPMGVRAMRSGAVNFLQKPFEDQELLDSIQQALSRELHERQARDRYEEIQRRLSALTRREREVFDLVVLGLANKQVAGRLGTSEKTVKVHRARVMRKTGADSLAALVRRAWEAGLSTAADASASAGPVLSLSAPLPGLPRRPPCGAMGPKSYRATQPHPTKVQLSGVAAGS
jgi:FixJ family two-component response regulator